MGTKPSNNFQSDRPESGGADRDGERENSGLLERDKQKFASDRAAERRDESPAHRVGEKPAAESGKDSGESTPSEN
jgi:hypothetical protein